MDDGSCKSKQGQGLLLNTQSFRQIDLKILQKALDQKFGLKTKLRKQREGNQIYIPADQAEKFKKIIARYILPSMRYKIGLTSCPKGNGGVH